MAAIFEAESRGKEQDEDILTSRVFGIFNIVNKSLVLGKFLEKVGINIPKKEIVEAQIELWERHGKCIPDAVIQTKSSSVFIESKLDSPLSMEQLKTEYNQGEKESDSFYLLCISKHFDLPKEIESLRKVLKTDKIFWTSWQNLYSCLLPIEKSAGLDKTSKALIKDLRSFLEAKRLRGFSGFKKTDYEKITGAYGSFDDFYNELSIFVQELESQLKKTGIQLRRTGMTSFHRDGRGTRLDRPEQWVTSFVSFAFGPKTWPFKTFWRDNYFFMRFCLDEPDIYVGYRLRPDRVRAHRKLLIARKHEILNYLKDTKDVFVYLDMEESKEVEDLSDEFFTLEELQKHREFALVCDIPMDKMTDRKLLNHVRKRIVSLVEMVSKLDLVPKETVEEVEEEEMEGEE